MPSNLQMSLYCLYKIILKMINDQLIYDETILGCHIYE